MDFKVHYSEHEMDEQRIVNFLFEHLDEYRDQKGQIKKALDYAMDSSDGKGGFVLEAIQDDELVGCVVINDTAMEGYIPQHILVYIAVNKKFRGKGIGKKLIRKTVEICSGNIALHVEYNNPARLLYQRLGFKSKYAEMRYEQLDDQERINQMFLRIKKNLEKDEFNAKKIIKAFNDCFEKNKDKMDFYVKQELIALIHNITSWEDVLKDSDNALSVVCNAFKNLINLDYNEQILLNRFKDELLQAVNNLVESEDWEYVWEEYNKLNKAIKKVVD